MTAPTPTPQRVSEERLAKLVLEWQKASEANQSLGLDTHYSDEMASALSELLSARPALEALREAREALGFGADALEDYSEHYAKKKGGDALACDYDGRAKLLRNLLTLIPPTKEPSE